VIEETSHAKVLKRKGAWHLYETQTKSLRVKSRIGEEVGKAHSMPEDLYGESK
jgi:hypothetical protein